MSVASSRTAAARRDLPIPGSPTSSIEPPLAGSRGVERRRAASPAPARGRPAASRGPLASPDAPRAGPTASAWTRRRLPLGLERLDRGALEVVADPAQDRRGGEYRAGLGLRHHPRREVHGVAHQRPDPARRGPDVGAEHGPAVDSGADGERPFAARRRPAARGASGRRRRARRRGHRRSGSACRRRGRRRRRRRRSPTPRHAARGRADDLVERLGERLRALRASSPSEPWNWTNATVTLRCSPRSGSWSRMCGARPGVGSASGRGSWGLGVVRSRARADQERADPVLGARRATRPGAPSRSPSASRTSPASASALARDDLARQRARRRSGHAGPRPPGRGAPSPRRRRPTSRGAVTAARRARDPQRARAPPASPGPPPRRAPRGPGPVNIARTASPPNLRISPPSTRIAASHRAEHRGDRLGQRLGADPPAAREALAQRGEARDVAEHVGRLELAPRRARARNRARSGGSGPGSRRVPGRLAPRPPARPARAW